MEYVIVFGVLALITVGLVLAIAFCVSRLARNRSVRWRTWVTGLAAPTLIIFAAIIASIIGRDGTLDGVAKASKRPWEFAAMIACVYGVGWVSARSFIERFARKERVQTGKVFQ